MSGYIRPVNNTATQHDGTEGLAVNDSLARRVLALAALGIAAPFARNSYPCVPISKHLIIKSGPFVHLTETATLKFLAEKTSIPVPHVQCAFIHKNQAVIGMERIQGISVAEACVGGTLRDSRMPRSWPRFGPFKTAQDFHFWLYWKEIKDMAAKQDGAMATSRFHPRGPQLFQYPGSGVIDWEFSGWYPHYWEYTSAWYWALMRPWWQDALPNFLDPHPEELAMEVMRQKWWGE
ncbi:hypothetical protein C8A01DRAFT_43100 [Parachaetomium inaequale]|uniref:Uncharacterized protein n=1 Tax=Parachaetomium inaequale TaxID=2588326 RepID=A0AAN6PNF2_9PEZI|nr:hypothetical protein C8A01DRAFT_43100 [Parachaetomium inaequale]